jgi:hypothetical protein
VRKFEKNGYRGHASGWGRQAGLLERRFADDGRREQPFAALNPEVSTYRPYGIAMRGGRGDGYHHDGGGGVRRRASSSHRSSRQAAALPVVEVSVLSKRGCRFDSAFEALAEIDGASVVCPAWLPNGLRASAVTVGSSTQVSSDQISLSGGHWIVTAVATPGPSSPGTLIESARLSDGTQIRLRTAGRRFVIVSKIHEYGGEQLVDITLTPSRLIRSEAVAAAKRLVSSLRVMPSDIIGRPASCQYPAVFAAVALVAGADTAQCPRWLPADVTLDLASAGPFNEYNPVEFRGSVGNGIFPHIVFEWVAHSPPGRPVSSMTLDNGRRVPIYFQPPGDSPELRPSDRRHHRPVDRSSVLGHPARLLRFSTRDRKRSAADRQFATPARPAIRTPAAMMRKPTASVRGGRSRDSLPGSRRKQRFAQHISRAERSSSARYSAQSR